MGKDLIFLPGTLTVINLSILLNQEIDDLDEEVEIVEETVDGVCVWRTSDGTNTVYEERGDMLLINAEGCPEIRKRIPQQIADDSPLYWAGDIVFWYEAYADCLYALPPNAKDDAVPAEFKREVLPEVFDLLVKMEEMPEQYGLWVFRYFGEEDTHIKTELLNDEDAMFAVTDYLNHCEGQCNLSDAFINEVLSFVGLPFADSVPSEHTKMVLNCLGGLSMTRLK